MRPRLLLALMLFSWSISPKLLFAQDAAAKLPPFASSSAIYLLYSGSEENQATSQIVQISKQGELATVLTGAEITAVTGALFATFDDRGLGFGPDSTLYFSDAFGDSLLAKPRNGEVAILTNTEAISTLVAIKTQVSLGMPAVGLDGAIYVIERTSDDVLRIDATSGEPELFVSKEAIGDVINQVVTDTVSLGSPLVFDREGSMYIVDSTTTSSGNLIRTVADQVIKVDPNGVPELWIPTGVLSSTRGLVFGPDGTLFIMDSVAEMIHAVTPAGEINPYLTADEIMAPLQRNNITLNQSFAVDSVGNLYILEGSSDSIVRFDTNRQGTVLVTQDEFEEHAGFRFTGNMAMAFAPGYPMWFPALERH